MPESVFRIRSLGVVPYAEASSLQHSLAASASDDYLLVLQHPHVYTLGVRADAKNILVDPESVGATAVRTDRGGDVTYHGPGQLIVYPILTLDDDPGAGRRHVRQIEQVVIDALADLGLSERFGGIGRLERYPGVWLGTHSQTPRKVAAIGVRTIRTERPERVDVSAAASAPGRPRVRTLHGVAISVDCDLAMFGHIVPCGIKDLPVTSLATEGLGLTVHDVAEAVIPRAVLAWSKGRRIDRQDVTPPSVRASRDAPSAIDNQRRLPIRVAAPARAPTSRQERVQSAEPTSFRRIRRAGVDPDKAVPLRSPKPPWLRVPVRMGGDYLQLDRALQGLRLHTVCEEAGCPNIYECWSEGTATFMINGTRCTRACGFCLVDTRHPLPLDPSEPDRVGIAVKRMGLAHAVVTCVARDDLDDGGAAAMAQTISAIRRHSPGTRVEVLISDCKGNDQALDTIFQARPDVLNHNIETVARLQRAVRPSAGYARSLAVLARAAGNGLTTKSGLMVGLGEHLGEVVSALGDLAAVGVTIATVGQYLRPTTHHLPVARWWSPQEFEQIRSKGLALGLTHVEASPLTRSSYHAGSAAEAAGAPATGVQVQAIRPPDVAEAAR